MSNKIGRNQLCSCGSGMKYKKCCWARGQKQMQIEREFRRSLDDYKKKSETKEEEEKVIQISTDEPQSAKGASDQKI